MANKKHEAQSLQQIVVVYGSDLVQGLAHDQVNSNRQLHGTNEFPKAYHTWLRLLLRQFNSGFTYLLAVAAVVSFFLGEHSNAIIMLGIIFFMGLFGFYQEFYADRTLQDLRARLRTSVRIIRGGREVTIDAQEIVVGDLVLFEPGDAVCADVRLVQQDGLLVDESVLRGESQPVSKMVITEIPSSIGSAQCLLLTGTKIVAGTAKGIVVAVGAGTMYGRLVNISVRPGRPSNFAQGINTFSLFVLIFVCVAVGGIFISHLLIQGASLNLVQLLVFYISLAVAVVPQALQVVINFSLARVAALLARRHVLVKRFAALEDLSGVEVLCVDKTGTLTENHLTVANVWASSAISSTEVLLAAYQGVATRNHKEPDPFDRALVQAVREGHVEQKSVTILKQIPFDPLQKCNVTAVTWHGGACVVVRGALEAVLKRCQADIEAVVALRAWVNEQEALGQRVLVIALGEGSNVHDLHALRLVGAIAFQDGIKKSAYAALEQARAMHIVVKMLTGDSAVVARQVAQALGIFAGQEEILTGDTYDELSQYFGQF